MDKKMKLTLAAIAIAAVFLITAFGMNNADSSADGEKNVTFNLVGDSYAFTIDEGATPDYKTTSGSYELAPGNHTINVYKTTVVDEQTNYSKLRTKTISVTNDATFTISPVNVILGNTSFVLNTDYTLTAKIIDYYGNAISGTNNAYVDGQTITYAVFNDETLSVLVKPKDTNAYKPAEILTMGGSVAKNFNVTLDSSLVMRIVVPEDAVVSLTVDNNRNQGDYTRVPAEVNTDMTTSTVRAYNLAKADSHYLRISGENYFTTCMLISGNAAYPRQYIVDESALTIVDGIRDRSYVNTDLDAYYKYNQANIVTNINYQNFLNMSVNDTKTLEAHKSIMVCQPEGNLGGLIGSSIYTMEPDFNYKVINFDGTPSDVVSINDGVLKAEKDGTAIVLVGYDAFGYYSFVSSYACNYALNTGIWSEYTDAFVVHVGTNGSIDTNMTVNEWLNIDLNDDGTYKYESTPMTEAGTAGKSAGNFLDSEIDVLYYIDGQPGYYYTFTPETGCTVAVWNPVFTGGKLTSYTAGTATDNGDGSFTVLMTEGRNIIQVNKDTDVAYQVATVKKTTLTVTYEYKTEEGKLYPGDVVTVQFGDLDSPQSRIYIYNTHTYIALFDLDGEGNLLNKYTDAPSGTVIGAYNFASDANAHKLTFTIPESAAPGAHTLEGAFIIKGFGSPLGNHHGAGVTAANNSAPGLNAILGKLPGVTFTVADYGVITYDTQAAVETGTTFTASKVVKSTDKGDLIDTLYVKKGDVITYTVNGNTNAYTGYVSGSCPAGWEWNMPGGNGSKQVIYTFTATVSATYTMSWAWGGTYAFSVKVVVIEGDTATGKQLVYGSGTIADANIADGFKIKDGKTVVRWNTQPDYTGTWYDIGDTVNLSTGTLALYGQVAVPTVTYDVPYGTFSLKNGEETVTSGSSVPAGTTLTLSYALDEDHVLALFMLNKQILLNSTTTTYTFTVNSNISITSVSAIHYRFYLVDSTGDDTSINGWYDSVAADPVLGLSNALDIAKIAHGEMKNSASGYWFTNSSIAKWTVGAWSSDGNYYNPNYAIWKWNPTDKWQLSNGFGTESDTVYIISHEKYIDVTSNGAAMINAGVTLDGEGAPVLTNMKAGYDGVYAAYGYIQLAPRDKSCDYAATLFGPSITVVWKNYDGTVLETDVNVIYGNVPTYDGETPVKKADSELFYTFKEWAPAVGQIYADIIYTATYTETTTICAVTWTEDEVTMYDYYDDFVKANNASEGKALLILRNVTLNGNYSLKAGMTIQSGAVFEIANSRTLTIPAAMTVTISEGGQLKAVGTGKATNNGAIVNNGTLTTQKSAFSGNISGSGTVTVLPYLDANATVTIYTGTGTVTHTATADSGSFGTNKATTLKFTINTVPTGWNDWSDFGTVTLTSFTFKTASDLVYVPSYIVGEVKVGSETYYTYYKVTAISDAAKTAINAKTISIVLPQALKNTSFNKSVTKVTAVTYEDTAGNQYKYTISETAPIRYDGITMYATYGNATAGADPRFCEQGKITEVTVADLSSLTDSLIVWSKNPMVCPPTWVVSKSTSGGSGSMVGTAISNDIFDIDGNTVTIKGDGSSVNFKISSDYTLSGKLVITDKAKLTVAKNVTLTICEGAELFLSTNGSVTNSGTIANNGTVKIQKVALSGTITGDGEIVIVPFFNEGETTTFVSGSGTVNHTKGQDIAKFNTDSGTTMVFTVRTASAGVDDWAVYGTAELTSITFKSNADLIYIPSYIVGKVQMGSTTHYTYCKITAISDDVLASINAKTISVVLPQALKNTVFSNTVTVITEGHYTDSNGNVYTYNVLETSPIWYNGYTTYTVYAYATENADARYCEQGQVTKIVFADDLVEPTLGLSPWAKSPLASNDVWIGSATPSFGDIIGLAVTNSPFSISEDAWAFNCDVEVAGDAKAIADLNINGSFSIDGIVDLDKDAKIVIGSEGSFSGTVLSPVNIAEFTDAASSDGNPYVISISGLRVSVTSNGTTVPAYSKVGSKSADVYAFTSEYVLISIDSEGYKVGGKIVMTYSAYIQGAEGVKINPFLTATKDVSADSTAAEIMTESPAVSCSVSLSYRISGVTFFTPVKDAKAPSFAALDIVSECGVSLNGSAVSSGDIIAFGEYTVSVDTEDACTLNGVEFTGSCVIYYYGQKIVISKI